MEATKTEPQLWNLSVAALVHRVETIAVQLDSANDARVLTEATRRLKNLNRASVDVLDLMPKLDRLRQFVELHAMPTCPVCGTPGRRVGERPLAGHVAYYCRHCAKLWSSDEGVDGGPR
jgi:formamidopyrimidine-DNA glycosylase